MADSPDNSCSIPEMEISYVGNVPGFSEKTPAEQEAIKAEIAASNADLEEFYCGDKSAGLPDRPGLPSIPGLPSREGLPGIK